VYRVLEAIVFSLCHINLYVLLLLLQLFTCLCLSCVFSLHLSFSLNATYSKLTSLYNVLRLA